MRIPGKQVKLEGQRSNTSEPSENIIKIQDSQPKVDQPFPQIKSEYPTCKIQFQQEPQLKIEQRDPPKQKIIKKTNRYPHPRTNIRYKLNNPSIPLKKYGIVKADNGAMYASKEDIPQLVEKQIIYKYNVCCRVCKERARKSSHK